MSHSMYEQAIIDAQDLKRMAEENAKKSILESITPHIKALVEQEILAEGDKELLLDEEEEAEVEEAEAEVAAEEAKADAVEEEGAAKEAEETATEADALDEADVALLASLLRSSTPDAQHVQERLSKVRKELARLLVLSESVVPEDLPDHLRIGFLKKMNAIIKEAHTLRNESILIKETGNNKVFNDVEKTLQEIKKMTRRLNRAVFSRLFEAKDLEELDATLVLNPEDEEEEDLLDDLDFDDIEFEIGGMEDEDEDEDEGEDEDEDEMEDEEVEDEEALDIEMEDEEEGEEEAEMEEMDEMEEGMDEVYEIDEADLRAALAQMVEGDAAEMAAHFGGGEEEAELFVDDVEMNQLDETRYHVNPNDLYEAINEVLAERAQRRSRRASKRSAPKKNLSEAHKINKYKKAVVQLQEQLTEMNLFNAKLLYANKLMQDKSLNSRQQRTIVEALDSAKTLREAKLLYKSLSKGISKGKSLNESRTRRIRGSASKSTSPAQSLNEGAGHTDRWAILAGIQSDK